MFRLTTLGTCSIRDSGGVLQPVQSLQPKRLALLAYLAAARPRGPHRRDTIVALLWPEHDEARARAALRQTLHAIRKALGSDAIVSHGLEAVELSGIEVACDAVEFETAVAAHDHDRALQLFGEFLSGLHLSECPGFERWVDAERKRLRAAAASSAWILAEHSAASRTADVVTLARRALALSECDDGAVRRAMRLLADSGERSAAIALYEEFAEMLRRELDVDVDDSTRGLAVSLRAAHPVQSTPPAPLPSAESESCVSESGVAESRVAESRRRIRSAPAKPLFARWRIAAGVALSVAALVTATQRLRAAAASVDARRVFIGEFSNQTHLASLDTLVAALTNSARASVAALQGVVLTDDDASAGTRVRASMQPDGDSIAFRVEVLDVETKAVTRVLVRRVPSRTAWLTVVPELSEQLSATIASALYPGWTNALSQPTTLAAYQWFVSGLRNIRLEDHDAAIVAFRHAFTRDTTFVTAGILAAMELYQVHRFQAADSLVKSVARRGDLRPVDARLLEWTQRSLAGDRFGARAAMQEVVALAPEADLAWLQLAIDNVETARPNEALAALAHVDLEIDRDHGWAAYWATRIEALHLLGDHIHELGVARDGLTRHPELRVLRNYELRALAALGRVAELNAELRVPTGIADSGATGETMVRQVALELRAHGHEAASRELLRNLIASYSRVESSREHGVSPLSSARTYYLAGEDAKAVAIYDSVYRRHPSCSDCAGVLGVLAARRGDRAAADRYSDALGNAESSTFQFGRPLLWQSRIAGTLGDRRRASALLVSAFQKGLEFDVMTHADPDLLAIRPDSIYRAFAHSP
jgi:DNA-binding SARP family transcriptional activator